MFGTLLLCLTLGTACARSDDGPGRPAGASGLASATARVLRIGLHSGPVTLDPHRHDEAVTRSVLGHVYETLVGFDANMAIVPQLALRWENPSDLVWRLFLRPGVTFHDGRPFTAVDAVASLERARTLAGSRASGYLVALREARAVDDTILELVTLRPYPILLNKLAFVAMVPRDAPGEITAPIGTGPYRFASLVPGRQMVLDAWSGYWGGPPAVAQVELAFLAESTARVDQLLAGTLDLVHEVAAADLPRLAAGAGGRRGVRVEARPGLLVTYLHLRADRPPFADRRVRRAVSLAFDRRRLVDELLAGTGTPAGQMLTRHVFGYEPAIAPPEQDVASAKRLLADAGYANGLDLDLEFRPGRELAPIVSQLAAVGIRARLVPRPWPEMYARLASGAVDFFLGGWACSSGDASDFFDSMVHTASPAGGFGDSNFSGYRNPILDGLIEKSGMTLDMGERRQTLRQALAIVVDDLPAVPLMVPHALYGVRDDVVWQPRLDGRVYAAEMRWRTGDAG